MFHVRDDGVGVRRRDGARPRSVKHGNERRTTLSKGGTFASLNKMITQKQKEKKRKKKVSPVGATTEGNNARKPGVRARVKGISKG